MNTLYVDKIKERLELLIDKSIRCNQTYELLIQTINAQNNHNELINIAPAFFSTVIENCITVLFIEVTKMFADTGNEESIIRLIKDVNNNIQQCEDSAASFYEVSRLTEKSMNEHYFSTLQSLINFCLEENEKRKDVYMRIKRLRNKHYAHRDKEQLHQLDKLFSKHKVGYVDFERLLVLNFNLCNALNAFFNETTTAPLAVGYDDFNCMLFYLEKGYKYGNS